MWLVVSRPRSREWQKWGTLPGAYVVGQDQSRKRGKIKLPGAKPLRLMRAIVRDYSRPGDIVCDPCTGSATTLVAALSERRRAVGAEVDRDTFNAARERLSAGVTPTLFEREAELDTATQGDLF